jgi:hypothetical protein
MGVGIGSLGKRKKYLVLLEFYGPARASDTRRLRKALAQLLKRYKGQKKEDVSADKRSFDPRRGWVKNFNPSDGDELILASAKKAKKAKKPKRRTRSR